MNQNVERLKKISFTALFAALVAVGAFLRVPVPMVPFTLQFLFANLAMLILGKKYGALSVVIYVVLGLIGVPIFTKGGGFQYIFEPTFGYLVGFALGNFAGGTVLERLDRSKMRSLLLAGAVNLLVVYACGATYFYFITKFYLNSPYTLGALLVMCCLKTLWSDTIFIFFSAFLAKRLNKALKLGFELDKDTRAVKHIASKIKKGGEASLADTALLLRAPLDVVCRAANGIRKTLLGKQFDYCGIINAKCGNCSEDCKFCAQSTFRKVKNPYPLLGEEQLFEELERLRGLGMVRSSAVLSGRVASDKEIDVIAAAVRRFKEAGGSVCVSAGLLGEGALGVLKAAGVDRIHNNLETSRTYFTEICTTHTYDEKLQALRLAKENGLDVCCGGLFGLGETWDDRVELALQLRELGVTSVPINFYMPPAKSAGAQEGDGAEQVEDVAILGVAESSARAEVAAGMVEAGAVASVGNIKGQSAEEGDAEIAAERVEVETVAVERISEVAADKILVKSVADKVAEEKCLDKNPLNGAQALTDAERRRLVALFRFLLPRAAIRLAGGRAAMNDFGRSLFLSGANAAIGGDMLTTAGLSVEQDLARIEKLGFCVGQKDTAQK